MNHVPKNGKSVLPPSSKNIVIHAEKISDGVPALEVAAHVEELTELTDTRQQLQNAVDRLCQFIMRSARQRVKLTKKGDLAFIQKSIEGEIALSTGYGRLDLIKNLLERYDEISRLDAKVGELEEKEYSKRFSPPSKR